MSGDCPGTHTTLLRSNDRYATVSVSLGDLLYVRPYSSWHDKDQLFEVRWRRGSMDISQATAVSLARQLQEALAALPVDPDCSGACFDTGETA